MAASFTFPSVVVIIIIIIYKCSSLHWYDNSLTVCLFLQFFTRKKNDKTAQCGRCRNTTHKGLRSFVYILQIAESKRQIETFCMKAIEMSTMNELKTEKSIHNPFDLVQSIKVKIVVL